MIVGSSVLINACIYARFILSFSILNSITNIDISEFLNGSNKEKEFFCKKMTFLGNKISLNK